MYVVVDTQVAVGQCVIFLGAFATEEAASEFITTLPDYESGRYGIDVLGGEE